jgi:hypothetical protein
MGFYTGGHRGRQPRGATAASRTNAPHPIRAGGLGVIGHIRQGRRSDLPLGCNSNGDRDQTTPAMRCACLPTQQQATHHPAIHGYESLPDAPASLPICHRSRQAGCSPWFRSTRSDGLRGLMLGCRVPLVRGRLVDLLIVARNGSETCHPIQGSSTTIRRILCFGTKHHCLKIGNHHLTDAGHPGDGQTFAGSNSMGGTTRKRIFFS